MLVITRGYAVYGNSGDLRAHDEGVTMCYTSIDPYPANHLEVYMAK
jgi:hypothetical protein